MLTVNWISICCPFHLCWQKNSSKERNPRLPKRRPVLPLRLSYPELIPAEAHGEVLYGEAELTDALTRALAAPRAWSEDWQRTWVARFDWGSLKTRYDDLIQQCAASGAGAAT